MAKKKIKRKNFLSRECYIIDNKMFILRKGTKFNSKFYKWYMSGSNIVPNRIYDYIMNKRR